MQYLAMIRLMKLSFFCSIFIALLAETCVSAQGAVISKKRVRFAREPVDQIAPIGSDVEIPCAPKCGDAPQRACQFVTWTHNGTLVDFSSRIYKSSNGSLILERVGYEDAGVYQCVVIAVSHGVFMSGRATLNIARLGTLVEEPQDVTDAIVDGAVRFQCSAVPAVPPPNITWYHDGVELGNGTSSSRHVILPRGILQITKLRLFDAGTYSCIVSNIAGTIASRNATLTLSQDSQPSSEDVLKVIQAPENVTVAKGQTAVFECLVQLAQDVVWKRIDESPLSSKAYVSGGNLIIPDALPSDEGVYGCIAKTSNRRVTLSANLIVDWPPVIVKPPEETHRFRGESWRFNCYTSAKPAPEIVWYKNGDRLRSHGRIKMFPNEQQPPSSLETPSGSIEHVRDLLITSIEVDDTAAYQCVAENYLGSATAAAALSYQGSAELGAPSNLTAVVLPNQRELELSWRLPPVDLTNRSVIFIVHFHESESGSENTMAVKHDSCTGDICKTVCCSNINLAPFTNYTFWVDALVDYHQTAPKFTKPSERIYVRSGDAASAAAPILLRETSEPGTVHLSWRQSSTDPIRGEIVEYRIEMKTEDRSSGGGLSALVWWRRPVYVSSVVSDYAVTGIEASAVLYVRVVPRTRAGYPTFMPLSSFPWLRYQRPRTSPQSGNNTVTFEEAPLIEALALNSTSIFVQWIAPESDERSDGQGAKWVILASRSNDALSAVRADVHINESSAILVGLSPDTVYQITVYRVISNGREGLRAMKLVKVSPTSRLSIVTPLPAVSARMIVPYPIPYCKTAGPGKLFVSWEKPPMNVGIALVTLRYSLLPLDSDEPLNVSAHVKTIDTADSQMIFTDLLPGRMYLFAAKAHTDSGYRSVFSHDINCSVPLAEPPPPQLVEAALRNGSLIVWWMPVDTSQSGSGSEIRMYHVRYSARPEAAETEWIEVAVTGPNTSTVIYPNSTSAVYYVTVSAENVVGRGADSTVKEVRSNSISTIVASSNSESSGREGATVVVKTSFKEGIIIGVCIGFTCIVVSVMICVYRSKTRKTGAKLTGADTNANGRPNGEVHCVELREMQTLLPQLLENADSDSKGAEIGATTSNGCVIRPPTSIVPPSVNEDRKLVESNQSQWSQHAPYPMPHTTPGVHHPNGVIRMPVAIDHAKLRQANLRRPGPITSSMPNLADVEKKRILSANGNGLLMANGPLRLVEDIRSNQSKIKGGLKNGYRDYGKQLDAPTSDAMTALLENDNTPSAISRVVPLEQH